MGQPQIVQQRPRESLADSEREFSLLLSGPLYQLYLRTRLARPALEFVVRRMLSISLICRLPPLLLATIAGQLTSGVAVSLPEQLGSR